MTRINCVHPSELHDKHLLAEYRELPRVFALAHAWHCAGRPYPIPGDYVLGPGHVKFFYDKLGYLAERQQWLVREMINRGFKPNFTTPLEQSFLHTDPSLWGLWAPSGASLAINRQRLADRRPKS